MDYSINKLLIDGNGQFVTVRSVITIRDKATMQITNKSIEVHEHPNKYQPAELSEPTDEQYQEYISNEETEEDNDTEV